jgi:hypothetical protein
MEIFFTIQRELLDPTRAGGADDVRARSVSFRAA